jgi:hypothetical protein
VNQQMLAQVERPVIDGFCLDLTTLFVPGRYIPAALGQLEALRKSGLYRSRWYAVPEEPITIAAYDTFEQQVRIVPGSYLWGITSAGFIPGMLVRIVEGSTGIPFMSDFMWGQNLAQGTPQVTLLTQPRLIVDPGYVDVEISNPFPLAIPMPGLPEQTPQLVLMCAEPCVVVEENLERPRYV